MKVKSKIYKGIEYVQVNDLPPEQREKIMQTLNKEMLIKILIDKKIVSNCIQFKDYEQWFDTIYKPVRVVKLEIKPVENSSIQIAFE